MYPKVVVTLILILFNLSFAHDLWLEKKNNRFLLYYGHKYYNHHNNHQKLIQYDPNNVQSVLCVSSDGKVQQLNFDKSKYPVRIEDGRCAIIYVIFSSGYWSKTPYGDVNKPKNEVDMVVDSWLSIEAVKRIEKWNKNLEKSFIDGLEVIPLNDPLKLKKGDKLRLKVLYKNKPIKGVPVYYNGKFRGTTDELGNINIRIKSDGLQIVETVYRQDINSEKADKIIYKTNLNFELGK